jgi:hypothetical protein
MAIYTEIFTVPEVVSLRATRDSCPRGSRVVGFWVSGYRRCANYGIAIGAVPRKWQARGRDGPKRRPPSSRGASFAPSTPPEAPENGMVFVLNGRHAFLRAPRSAPATLYRFNRCGRFVHLRRGRETRF